MIELIKSDKGFNIVKSTGRRGNKTIKDIFIVKHLKPYNGYFQLGSTSIITPLSLIGKRIKIKIEIIDDLLKSGDTNENKKD